MESVELSNSQKLFEERSFRPSRYAYNRIQIETFSLCNMACTFCPYPLRTDKENMLDESFIFRLLDQIDPADPGLEYVSFHQFNEPLIDQRIFDFIKYATKRQLSVFLVTNCLQLSNPKIREKLIDASPKCLKLSVQTVTKDRYIRHRGTSVPFESYIKGIDLFLKEAAEANCPSEILIDVGCNFHTARHQIAKFFGIQKGDSSVPDTLKETEEEVRSFLKNLSQFNPLSRISSEEIRTSFEASPEIYNESKGLQLGKNIFLKVKPFHYGHALTRAFPIKKMLPCPTGILGVLADGSVVPCCLMYDKDLDHSLILGNIKQNSIKSILDQNIKKLNGIKTGNGDFDSIVCRKCQGSNSKQGARWRNLKNSILSHCTKKTLAHIPPYDQTEI